MYAYTCVEISTIRIEYVLRERTTCRRKKQNKNMYTMSSVHEDKAIVFCVNVVFIIMSSVHRFIIKQIKNDILHITPVVQCSTGQKKSMISNEKRQNKESTE